MAKVKEVETPYVKPSDTLASALVSDPRWPELIGEMFREASGWLSESPEVGYGQYRGVHKMIAWLEEKGKTATIEILQPPKEMPNAFTYDAAFGGPAQGGMEDPDGL